jgi:hypothetical protein
MVHDTPPYGHAPIPNIIDLSQKKQLFDLKVKDHYGMQHTALFSCTHIPNIIDLSRKKQLFDLEVKVQTKAIMVHNTLLVVMHPIRWCVTYRNDLRWTLSFDLEVK